MMMMCEVVTMTMMMTTTTTTITMMIRGTSHFATGKFYHKSIRHKELFVPIARTLKEFDETMVANWLVTSLHGGKLTIYDDIGGDEFDTIDSSI